MVEKSDEIYFRKFDEQNFDKLVRFLLVPVKINWNYHVNSVWSKGLRNGEHDTYLSFLLANFMSLC